MDKALDTLMSEANVVFVKLSSAIESPDTETSPDPWVSVERLSERIAELAKLIQIRHRILANLAWARTNCNVSSEEPR